MGCSSERDARKERWKLSLLLSCVPGCLLQQEALPACWQEDPVWLCLDVVWLLSVLTVRWR